MKWLKQFGIISRLQQMDIYDKDRDDIVDAVKDELDKQFK